MQLKKNILLAVFILTASMPSLAQLEVPAYPQEQAQEEERVEEMSPKWVQTATIQLQGMMRNRSGRNLASAIQSIIHPTGRNAEMQHFNVLNLGDHMMVQMTIAWTGAYGNPYITSVNWELAPNSHLRAIVVGDSALFSAEKRNKMELNTYFEQTIFPIFYSNMRNLSYFWK